MLNSCQEFKTHKRTKQKSVRLFESVRLFDIDWILEKFRFAERCRMCVCLFFEKIDLDLISNLSFFRSFLKLRMGLVGSPVDPVEPTTNS
jgi:hypothetical protein